MLTINVEYLRTSRARYNITRRCATVVLQISANRWTFRAQHRYPVKIITTARGCWTEIRYPVYIQLPSYTVRNAGAAWIESRRVVWFFDLRTGTLRLCSTCLKTTMYMRVGGTWMKHSETFGTR